MKSEEVRKKFLSFFEKRGHSVIPSASLVPENDPSVLFTTAGVQPIVPYILQGSHPKGNQLVSVQKCVRTTDIEDIGDKTHATFFEMLGNWSIGDYFKEDAIKWSFEFLTDEERGLGIDVNRLYVTIFEGDENAPKDEESFDIWAELFKSKGLDPEKRIFPLSAKSNWWPQPKEKDIYSGPCGPSTEMFYDLNPDVGEISSVEDFKKADDEQRVVEIWNDVFMEYEKKDGKVVGKLPKKNVDTGAGFERLLAVLQKKDNIFETDVFSPIMEKVQELSKAKPWIVQGLALDKMKAGRIVADHIRTSVFLISDGVLPSNTDRGYVLRRLLRRAVRFADILGIQEQKLSEIANVVAEQYKKDYSNILENVGMIKEVINEEEKKFRETLKKARKEFEKVIHISPAGKYIPLQTTKNKVEPVLPSKIVFDLITVRGLSREEIEEMRREKDIIIQWEEVDELLEEHKQKSQTAAAGKFKGGLANSSEETVKLHTAHHLLLSALQKVLGENVKQRGSNITSERLRIDFSFERKMTDEERQEVEAQVNEWISAGLDVVKREMKREEAEKIGAEMEFGAKYPDVVSVYFIEDKNGNAISKEFCGGPHVKNTSELGRFKIKKEEAVSAGVRRIKAVLE